MMRYVRFWALAVLFSLAGVLSSYAGAGRTGGLILDLPHRSVRAAGLGEAFATYDNDVNAVLWNPAGLSTLQRAQFLGGWSSFEQVFDEAGAGLYYALFAGATPIEGVGVLGAALQLNGKGSIDITTDSPDIIATESLGTDWVLSLSYAESLAPNLRAGVTGKVIRLVLGTGFEQASSATSYAADFGLQYDLGRYATIGLSALNVGTRVQFKDANQSDPLPRKFHTGVAIKPLNTGNTKLTISFEAAAAIDKLTQDRSADDFVQTVVERMKLPENKDKSRAEVEDQLIADRGVGIHAFAWERLERAVGAELTVLDTLAVRAGYKKFDDASEPPNVEVFDRVTFGFGINLAPFGVPLVIDYANGMWGPGGPSLKRVNSFALSFAF